MESFVKSFPRIPLPRETPLQPDPVFSNEISCALEYVKVESNPRYQALSYVWGDAEVTVPIKLDGVDFPVTVNLATVLRYLRKADEERVIWIDAICIDQSNTPERNHQVSIMAKIYGKEESVQVWLGEESPSRDGEQCLSLLRGRE